MRVVKTLSILFREPNNGVVNLRHLWYGTRQLEVLNHLEVSLTGFFGRPNNYAPYDHSYISYGWSRALIIPLRGMLLRRVRSLLTNEPLQLSLPYKSFNLLLQVLAVDSVMTMVTVEATILIPRSFIGISLQLVGECQGSFVFNLHQDLIDWGN